MIIELGKVHSNIEYEYLRVHYRLDCYRKALVSDYKKLSLFEKDIQKSYNISKPIKNIVCDLIQDLRIYRDEEGNVFAQFRSKRCDEIARLLIYGNRDHEADNTLPIILQRRK